MNNKYPGYLEYSCSSPGTPVTEQSQQMLQGFPTQYPYYTPFPNQVCAAQYYDVDHQSQHMAQSLSPHQKQSEASSCPRVSTFSHDPSQSCLEYPPFHYETPRSNYFPNIDRFLFPAQQPLPFTDSYHTGHFDLLPMRTPSKVRRSLKGPTYSSPTKTHHIARATTGSNKSGVLRGPPKKPRQSDHALWVGNLPCSTDIMKLKEHFSAGAMATIVSIFWISRSKSAFVNYRTSEALIDSMNRFNDSKFEGVRLVCRARKADIPIPIPTTTASVQPRDDDNRGLPLDYEVSMKTQQSTGSSSEPLRASEESWKAPINKNAKKRFFVMKSLAREDLELSVQNGQWMTQEHNETTLNEAFARAEDVYLIFSANKSGEYFGYARMQGLINILAPESRWKRSAEYAVEMNESDMPEIVFTPGTERAPQGAIFIDAYRGTIFWEADVTSQDNAGPKQCPPIRNVKSGGKPAEPTNDQGWNLGNPFEIKWMSTNRLPFYRTRGLRNLWNANRDIKIARDGTELETNAGIQMLELFHQTKLPVFWEPNSSTSVGSLTQSPPTNMF